jgi:hypothetical protein
MIQTQSQNKEISQIEKIAWKKYSDKVADEVWNYVMYKVWNDVMWRVWRKIFR